MGNAIKISIELDYESAEHQLADGTIQALRAGEPLIGKVIVQVKKRVKGDVVKLFAHGMEKVYTKHNKKIVTTDRNLLQAAATLIDMRDTWMKPGRHKFPFVITIPSSLPSSMCLGDLRHGCRIHYKISACMGSVGTDRFFRIASTPVQDIKVPCFVEPKTEEVKSMKLLNVGSVTFGASVNDTQVGRGQDINVSVACINNATTEIKSVDIKMVEMVTFSAHGQSYDNKICLLERKKIDLPGLITAKTSRDLVKQSQRENGTTETDMLSREQMFHMLVSGESAVRITIPKYARDTYAGTIVKVNHYLKIKIITGALSSNLNLKIPLFVGNSSEQMQRPPSYPITLPPPPPPPISPTASPTSVHLPPAPTQDEVSPQEIPIVAATLVVPMAPPTAPSERSVEPMVVEAHAVVIGGTPSERVQSFNSSDDEPDIDVYDIGDDDQFDFGNLVPLQAPPKSAPSLSRLLEDMVSSVNDYSLISERLTQSEWKVVFKNLQPADYGSIVAHVNNDVDQPRVAALLAECIARFTCSHCIQALCNTADWNRTTVVIKLIPLCVDLQSQKDTILAELSPWEMTVTAEDFERAVVSS